MIFKQNIFHLQIAIEWEHLLDVIFSSSPNAILIFGSFGRAPKKLGLSLIVILGLKSNSQYSGFTLLSCFSILSFSDSIVLKWLLPDQWLKLHWCLPFKRLRCFDSFYLREHPLMMSDVFWGFLTPHPPQIRFCPISAHAPTLLCPIWPLDPPTPHPTPKKWHSFLHFWQKNPICKSANSYCDLVSIFYG